MHIDFVMRYILRLHFEYKHWYDAQFMTQNIHNLIY